VTLVLFDVLWLDGHPVTDRSYDERRALLRELVADGDRWTVPDHVVGHGSHVLAAARAQNLEGVVAKRRDCPYEPGAAPTGGGRSRSSSARRSSSSGGCRGRGAGATGSGRCSSRSARRAPCATPGGSARASPRPSSTGLAQTLGPLETDTPAVEVPKAQRRALRDAVWVTPRWLAEVDFSEWTPDGQLRHPSYKGLRDDKPTVEVVRETPKGRELLVEGHEVRLSNPDKVLYPAAGLHQDGRARVLPGGGARPAAAHGRPAADAQALSQRRRRQVLLREERPVAPPGLGPDRRDAGHPLRACARTARRSPG
jgi:bifunctional non-homologous end joining protein LigD